MKRVLLLGLIAACDSVTTEPDAAFPADAPLVCHASAGYGGATAGTPQAESRTDGGAPDFVGFLGALNDDPAPDVLSIELYRGSGAFATGEIVPGTFPIEGDEAQYERCGVCVLIYADVDPTSNAVAGYYLATAGTVTITEVTPRLVGSITDVALAHVVLDGSHQSTPAGDDCTSSITAHSFDAAVVPQ